MSVPAVFNFKGRELRSVVRGGKPWFVARDAGEILGLSDALTSVAKLPAHWKDTHPVRTPGGMQDMTVICESGLYRLVMRSDRPEAVEFQDWIAGEVLPSIRKTGRYEASGATPPVMLSLDQVREMIREDREQTAELITAAIIEARRRVAKIKQPHPRQKKLTFAQPPRNIFTDAFRAAIAKKLSDVAGRVSDGAVFITTTDLVRVYRATHGGNWSAIRFGQMMAKQNLPDWLVRYGARRAGKKGFLFFRPTETQNA